MDKSIRLGSILTFSSAFDRSLCLIESIILAPKVYFLRISFRILILGEITVGESSSKYFIWSCPSSTDFMAKFKSFSL